MGENTLSLMIDEQVDGDGLEAVLAAAQSMAELERYPEIAEQLRAEAKETGISPDALLEHVRGGLAARSRTEGKAG